MDKSQVKALFEGPRIAFEAEGRAFLARLQFVSLAEHLAPRDVARSYAAGLDALQSRLGTDHPRFAGAADQLVDMLNGWIERSAQAHYGLIRTMRDPTLQPTIEDYFRAIEYSVGFAPSKLLGDLIQHVAGGLVCSSPEIKAISEYYGRMGDLDFRVAAFFHETLWPAISGIPPSRRLRNE